MAPGAENPIWYSLQPYGISVGFNAFVAGLPAQVSLAFGTFDKRALRCFLVTIFL